MSKAKKMSREIEPEDIEDMEDMEDIGDEEMGDMEMDEDMMPNMPNKFWNVQLKPDEEKDLEPPAIPGFEVHITNACFGSTVKPGSRTVVVTKDDENKEVPVCVLLEGKHESQSLNLVISEGLNFSLKGKNVSGVSLTGYIAPPSDMDDMDEGALSMDDDDENLDDEELPPQLKEAMRKRKLDQAREDDNEPLLLDEDKKESIEPPSKRAKIDVITKQQPNKANQQPNKKDSNNSQKQSQQKPSAPVVAVAAPQAPIQSNANANANAEKPLSKNQKKKQKKLAAKAAAENVENPGAPQTTTTTVTVTTTTTNKTNNENNDNNNNSMVIVNHEEDSKEKMDEKKSPKSIPNQSPKDTPQTNNDNNNNNNESNKKSNDDLITMKNGLKYKDVRVGTGEVVKPGQTVNVFYVGQLDDKSIFDKTITPPGFDFVVGKGEVIKGWDEGIKGMKVGGKRRLIVPAHLGYGKAGTDGIPPNATLTFTIEVKKVTK